MKQTPAQATLDRARWLYTEAYARHYRAQDEALREDPIVARLGGLLRDLCRDFPAAVRVLDLGCGTGRYFDWLENVETLVGVDASPAMLGEARRKPADRPALRRLHLIEGDLLSVSFKERSFHLVYAIGVLAEHAPLTGGVVESIYRWLGPGGVFVFTTVHPLSPSIRLTLPRRFARALVGCALGPAKTWLTQRLCAGGLYADESLIRRLLGSAGFQFEQLARFSFGQRWHCLCVARKATERRP